jgi:transposase InsO family protein
VKYGFVERQQEQFAVAALCRALRVSRSGFYAWQRRAESARRVGDRQLLPAIARLHAAAREAYGARKTWVALNQAGIACGKHRVARLRREAGIEAKRKRRFRIMIEHQHTAAPAPNLVQRVFTVAAPNMTWVGDTTVVRTRAGWLHVAALLDLYARRVVGWAMAKRQDVALVLSALRMALWQRRPPAGLIHHTDQAGIYAAGEYRALLAQHGVVPSMSGKGNCFDNAVVESFFSTLKNELTHHCSFVTHEEARTAIFEFIEVFYNRQRLHQTLGDRTPVEVETLYLN